jgi:GAF domain-containing protein
MILDTIKAALEVVKAEIDADSCTFYVRDPFWRDELRLIAMPGVHIKEPMHGFAFPPHSKRVVSDGATEIFSSETESESRLREVMVPSRNLITAEKRFLFGDFVERERIKSSARLMHKVNKHLEAVLFVNFVEKQRFTPALKQRLRNLLSELVIDLPGLQEELRTSETNALIQAIRMFPPTYQGAEQFNEWEQPLDDYFRSLLGVVMAALDLKPGTALGTIHTYDSQTETLNLAAPSGAVNLDRAESLSIASGEGIISWVAIRRKALLISELEGSNFEQIHIAINLKERIRSEVAIPIFGGKELLGVLNLESTLPDAFKPTCVRSLWFAVNRAAVAHRLSQQKNINARLRGLSDGLLALCAEAVGKNAGTFSLNSLADLAKQELEAARCGIWRYDDQERGYELAGISPPNFEPKTPRTTGFSNFIRQLGKPVWIDKKVAPGGFVIEYQIGPDLAPPDPDQNGPGELNIENPNVKSLLGTPIAVRGEGIGIAWLEYESEERRPKKELMKLASGFAAYAGLVIEFSEVDLVDRKAVQSIGEQLSRTILAPGPLNFKQFPRLEGYVKSQPFLNSRIGGDFYGARVIDEQTAGVLVGDGRGHAVTGALNMLPLLTVFEAFWKESRSVTHIMDKIRGIANQLGVQGTAVYCVFSLIEKRLWLSATSAAHPFLALIRRQDTRQFPPDDNPASGGMLGVPLLAGPLAEEHIELSPGDLIIIFTDGLEMDVAGVTGVALSHREDKLETIANAVFEEALQRRKKAFDDDVTVLVIRVK